MRLFRVLSPDTGAPLMIDGQIDLSASDLDVLLTSRPDLRAAARHPYAPDGYRVVEAIDDHGDVIERPVTPAALGALIGGAGG